MTALQTAMSNIDREDAIGGAALPLVDRPSQPHVIAVQAAVAKAVDGASRDALAEAQAWADAQAMVGRAMKRGGRDPLAVQPTDAQAMRSIANLLIAVRETDETATEAALRTAFERGEAVARALSGTAGQ